MMPEHDGVIDVRDLRFRYAGSTREVLDGVDLRVAAGERVLLLGPSGSGKSTLALALTGLIPQRIGGDLTGQVIIAGRDSSSTPLARLCTHVCMVMQDPASQMVMQRVDEEVAFGLENLRAPRLEMTQRIETALAQVGMSDLRRALVDRLSGGEQQRVALAAVLPLAPQVLILDEPTASLDPASAADFFDALTVWSKASGAAIVVIEHRLELVLPLIDRVVALDHRGQVLGDGPPRRFFREHAPRLEEEGIRLPATQRLWLELRRRGHSLPSLPLDIDEAAQELRGLTPCPAQPSMRPPAPAPRPASPPAIRMERLRFRYAKGPEVLHGVDLTVQRGESLALVGSNGSGKSTLARHIAGLVKPQNGALHVLGERVTRRHTKRLARQVGYVLQNPEHQLVADSVVEEIGYSMHGLFAEDEIARRADLLMTRFGLSAHAEADPFRLSWGQKRRLSVATMVALDQPILILDEPTLGQDQRNAAALATLLQDLNRTGTTVVLITHDMELVAEVARTVAVLHQGRLLFTGRVDGLFALPDVMEAARLELPPLARLGRLLGRADNFTAAGRQGD
jgi:energy-coupling factor transport system ATP-binding protein